MQGRGASSVSALSRLGAEGRQGGGEVRVCRASDPPSGVEETRRKNEKKKEGKERLDLRRVKTKD